MKPQFIENQPFGDDLFLENKSLYFIIAFEGEGEPLVLLRQPDGDMGRFLVLPSEEEGHYVAFLDDVIRLGLNGFFPDKKIAGVWSVKVSRDAELYLGDEYDGDLLEKIKTGLEERHIGLPTRFLYDATMPEAILEKIKPVFNFNKNDLIPGARYHNFNDFFGFPNPAGLQVLHDQPMPPLNNKKLDKSIEKAGGSILAAMREKDLLLHFPYQKYDYVEQLINEAAEDELVQSLSITLYRVASKSSVCEGLLSALKNGKKVTVFIEAKARFDEETNLRWGERLREAGATVRYSYPGVKVHTKLLIISRLEDDKLRNYAYLATGNFNEKTSTLYADHALFTTDPRLADEAVQVFDLLEKRLLLPKTKHLMISPFSLRSGFEKLIDKEIKNAQKGKDAWMIVKMNSLEDRRMSEKLIEASKAGVKIRMIVRGMCCLLPGVKNQTENISAVSIVDRFLEHARIYIFANDGDEKMYLASADWMTRNLDRRVEVAFPIYDKKIQKELRQIVDYQLNDNVKARLLGEGKINDFKKRKAEDEAIRAQVETYRFLE